MKIHALVLVVAFSSSLALGEEEIPRDRCLELLRHGLNSDEFWPAIHAAEALTLAGQTGEVQAFLKPKLPTEKDEQQICGIARELVRAGDTDQAALMLDILRADDPYAHSHAAESLYKVGYGNEPGPLKTRFQTTDDTRLKLMSAAALAKFESGPIREEAFQFLRQQLEENSEPELYKVAAWILGRIGDKTDIPRLQARIPDATDPLTLAYLHHSLALLGDESGRDETLKNLESDDPDIRTYAAVFAGEAGMKNAIAPLTKQLDDPDLDAGIRAAQALIVLSNTASE